MRAFSYKRLFKKLIDLDMTNNELMEKAKVSKSTFYKMKNGQNVTTDVFEFAPSFDASRPLFVA